MKALIFAAGLGKRMMPLTADKPKPMVEVLGKPILEHILKALPEAITEIIIVTGYRGEMIRKYFAEEFDGKKIVYLEQKEQLGTGDALMGCRSFIGEREKFLIVYADDIRDKETLERAIAKDELAIFVAEVKYPERFGIVVTDPSGRIIDLEEAPQEPKTDLAVTGAYLLDGAIFNYSPRREANGEYYINSMLIPYMKEHEVYAEKVSLWIPIGYPEDVAKASAALSGHG